jgi:cytochrome P450
MDGDPVQLRGEEVAVSATPGSTTGVTVRAYPFGAAHRLELHDMYRYAQEHEPLCRVRMPYGEEAWLVTRYADVKTVLGDSRFSRSVAATRDEPRVAPDISPLGLLDMDPPEHTRLRRLVSKAFTARQVEQLRPRIEQIANDLVTSMVTQGPPADLVASIGVPLPMTVICELLGVRYADRGQFETWTDGAMSTTALTPEQRADCFANLMAFMTDLVDEHRRTPADDLLGTLVLAHDEQERLSEGELTFLALTLLGAGYETTANQIGNFAYLLLTHPDQLTLLRQSPELIPGAVEELLRFVPLGTNSAVPRYATTDVELSGGTVPAGDPVFAFTPAANRDPRVFPDPDCLDVTRQAAPHVSFGHGGHHCVGAPLARLELQVALTTLLAALPGLRLAVGVDELVWKTGGLVRGLVALPVAW